VFAYIGSRTTRERNARGDGITVCKVLADHTLELVQVVGELVNPSYLALDRRGERLYTVHGDQTAVSVFAVDRATGRLRHLQQQDCGGRNPVHLALDPTGRFLVVSNHLSGNVAVLPVHGDGTLGAVSQRLDLPGEPGPHRIEQPFSKPHFNPFSPDGRHVVVPDKGLDRVFTVPFTSGRLDAAGLRSVVSREGAGPRHVAFHPHAAVLYAVNELDSTVTAYRSAPDGALVPFQCLPTLPDDHIGKSRAAGIAVHPTGRFVVASNRGHDSLALFAVAPDTQRLHWVGAFATGVPPPALLRTGR